MAWGNQASTCSPTSVFFSDTEENFVNVLVNVGGAFSALTSNYVLFLISGRNCTFDVHVNFHFTYLWTPLLPLFLRKMLCLS